MMVYLKSILVGILAGTASLVASTLLMIAVVVWQVRQRAPGVAVGVDIRSMITRTPMLWIAALIGFGIGFYWQFRGRHVENLTVE